MKTVAFIGLLVLALAAPSAADTVAPAPTPVMVYAPSAELDPTAGLIQSVQFSEMPLHSRGSFTMVISTREDIDSIAIHVAGHNFSLKSDSPGVFSASGRIPWIPWFLKKSYPAVITAISPDGSQQSVTITIAVK